MSFPRSFQLFVLTVLLTSCAILPTAKRYNALLESWRGGNADNLIAKWGYPDRVNELHNGNKLYAYIAPISTIVSIAPNIHYAQIDQYSCNTVFEINRNKQIVNVRSNGNDCVASENTLIAKLNPEKITEFLNSKPERLERFQNFLKERPDLKKNAKN